MAATDMVAPRIETLIETDIEGKFVIEPQERGFGTTLGNALRRVLLSSIEGAAITSIKIDGVLHEFSTIPGVKEDTTEIILNLRQVYVKAYKNDSEPKEPKILKLEVQGPGNVTAADIQTPSDVEIINPEAHIATLSDETAKLSIEMTVEMGRGFMLPEKQERLKQTIGVIPVGAAFSPVRRVNFTVDPTRVGHRTDFDRLTLEVTTNGTIKPSDAVSEAAKILDRHLRLLFDFSKGGVPYEEGLGFEGRELERHAPDARIEELDFSVRTYNCLKKANVLTISELVQMSEADLMAIRNFGKKSLTEVREKLFQLGLALKKSKDVTASPSVAVAAVGEEDEEEELSEAEEDHEEEEEGAEEESASAEEEAAPAAEEEE